MEIRLHGRGGQGGVTCAKIIAAVYAGLGKSVQSFGDYGGERSGAPVRAYVRVDERPIENRNKVYQPDHLLVLDASLLGDDTVAGLVDGGTLLLNAAGPVETLAGRFGRYRLAVVDATGIARRHQIGSRSLVIVNTTIAGAFARVLELPLAALEEAYHHLGLERDVAAAREAYQAVAVRDASGPRQARPAPVLPALPPVVPLVEHTRAPATGLKTGSWRSQRPRYQRGLAPCTDACPAGNDVVGFVQALARDGVAPAAAILGRTTPLAAVCGRVCPGFCMQGCNRRALDGAVDVRGLERWISDHQAVAERGPGIRVGARRFAVVGGGPAGLAAAYTLVRAGQRVTIYDAEAALGGVLRTGIPSYRLPRDVLDREIAGVLALGVEAHLHARLDRVRLAALARDVDAVVVATGLQRLRGLDGPGADLPGVEQGIHFLRRVNLGEGARVRGHVVVLGGGNTAMDCARSALRAGAARVTVAYRRGRAEMPAIPEEVREAEEEGVAFQFLRAPIGFEGDDRVARAILAEVELGPPDASGRRQPVVSERRRALACDHVLLALGQSADLRLLPEGWTIVAGRIHDEGEPLPVFCAGDVATGDGTVAHAIGDGRRAAARALAALGFAVDTPPAGAGPVVRPEDVRLASFAAAPPQAARLRAAAARTRDFAEVSRGLPGAHEAQRCFSCGDCTRCDTCLVYCPEGVIHRRDGGYEVDLVNCKGCGICVVECPRRAMVMEPETQPGLVN